MKLSTLEPKSKSALQTYSNNAMILKSIRENTRNRVICLRTIKATRLGNLKQLAIKKSTKNRIASRDKSLMTQILMKWINQKHNFHNRNAIKNNTKISIKRVWNCMNSFKTSKQSRIYSRNRKITIVRFYN
jgi:hypothetical protein